MTLEQIILSIAGLVAAAGVIIGGLVALYRMSRRIGDAIGLDKAGRTLSERIDRVEHQLWENGGSSLADRVNRIEKVSIETGAEVRFIKDFILSGQLPVVTPIDTTPVPRTRRKKAS